MRVLVACEFSGVVRRAFAAHGHEAYSCDLLESEDDSPYHVQCDVLDILDCDWDLMIAHPPCTFMSMASNCRIQEPGRLQKRELGFEFFMQLVHAPIPMIAVENPRGYPERAYRPADQVVQPYQFGHPESKATCLWLKNLPPLDPTDPVEPRRRWDGKRFRTFVDSLPSSSRRRSITFSGIASAMASQWGQLEPAMLSFPNAVQKEAQIIP